MIVPSYEHVEADDGNAFRCIHNSCQTFAAEHPMHFHPAYELTWIIRSRGTRYVGDSVERYTAGDLVLSGPSLPHCWRDDPDLPEDDRPEWIIAQFDPARLGAGLLELPEASALRRMLDRADRGLAFSPATAARIAPLLRTMIGQSALARLLALLQILDILSGEASTTLAAPGYHASNAVDQRLVDRLDRVQRYISANLADQVSQGEIATELGMSASAFSKFFRAATSRTFVSLVKLLRINAGCQRLANGDERITTIAFDCGYPSTSLFDLHFRELKGMSPSDYRHRMKALAGGREMPAVPPRFGKITATDRENPA